VSDSLYRASVGITTNMKISSTRWIAKNANQIGVDRIWIGEDIDIGQDVFVLTAATILQSKDVAVGTAIIPITVHKITDLARAAVSLRHLTNSNFAFGTGIGGMQDLLKRGIHIKKPVTLLEEAIDVLHRLWKGETTSVKTELFEVKDFSLSLKQPVEIPIFLGVRGPQMLKLTGRIADGVILSGPFDYLKQANETINKAAENAGRHKKEVERVVWLPTIPTFKGGNEKLAKRVVALVVADMPDPVLEMLSIEKEKLDLLKEAVKKSGVSGGIDYIDQEIMDMFSISGDKEHMVDQFEKLNKFGATEVVLGPPFSGDWRGAMEDIFEEILRRH
jgi:5,10-methylenetetrahydromethanopterin reductase